MSVLRARILFFGVPFVVACFSDPPPASGNSSTSGVGTGTDQPTDSSSGQDGSTTSDGSGASSTSSTSTEDSSTAPVSDSTAPPVDYALAFEGANPGVTPSLPGLPPEHTVEFWLRSGPAMHGSFLHTATMDPSPRGWFFIHDDPPAGLAFTNCTVFVNYDERPAWDYIVDPTDLRTQVGWHHVAITKSIDGLVRLWIDGGMAAEYQFGAPFAVSERPLTIGPSLYDAMIDDVRISDVVRYDGLFEPPIDMMVDANTLYLWRLDEGEGTEAVDDVGGVAFDLVDPIWVER